MRTWCEPCRKAGLWWPEIMLYQIANAASKLLDPCVVAAAVRAAVVDEMERREARLSAVVAQNHLCPPGILCGEPLGGQQGVQHL